ncbi:uncharacterized protein B0P05DRAFT_511039 [Gilbertella persicaria]|uniref:uncharacterized protein n=1 Tax=Gilbertella persicaria TaxID=101096 RepID=UPI00222007A9|nr:uncharacterized protein B0P05DRAFT_511039 [Gilbertella persicaria]KAI8078024.1 hypothetical protein B0P05DRAFT_511039 [Gilbertella persicaria]
MLQDIKNRFKRSTPSLRSIEREKASLPQYSASTPVLNTMAPTPPRHIVSPISARKLEKSPVNASSSSSSSISRSNSSIQLNESHTQHNRTSQSSATSSSTSLSMPPTPPMTGQKPLRYPSNVSLPISFNSDYLMNHSHLKPGNNAELLSYDKTINMYRENAKKTNDPNLQCDLAIFIYESCKRNQTAYMAEAVKMLKTLALRGHAESQYYLANIYASGALHKSGEPNFNNAFPLFLQAAKHQHSDAAYRAAKCYEDGLGCLKNKSKAAQYYKLASTLNHPGAMYRLGIAAIHGDLGLQRNVREGNKWLKRSAESATPEYPHALHEFGLLHEKGLDGIIFKDHTYSVKLYKRAAELGYSPSAYRLGQCYEYGYLGCQKSVATSISYYHIAASQGHPEACLILSAWYLAGDPPQLAPSEDKAFYWAKIAAEKGLPKAEFALGYYAQAGIGRPQDPQEAIAWYQKAAEHGHKEAQKRLEDLNKAPKNSTPLVPSLVA